MTGRDQIFRARTLCLTVQGEEQEGRSEPNGCLFVLPETSQIPIETLAPFYIIS